MNRPYGKKPKPRGVAVCSRCTSPVGVDVLGDPKKTNNYRNRNGGSKREFVASSLRHFLRKKVAKNRYKN